MFDSDHASIEDKNDMTQFSPRRFLHLMGNEAFFQALKISGIYFLIGSGWIILSDTAASVLFPDPNDLRMANIAKGWIYVFATAYLLFLLIRKEIGKVTESRQNTERMNLRLEKSNALFSAILESPPEIVFFSADINYCYTAFNEQHRKTMFDRHGIDIRVGRNVLDFTKGKEPAGEIKAKFDRVLSGESFSNIEKYSYPDGSIGYWHVYYSPIAVQDGEIIGLTCFSLDITELKKAQDTNRYLSYHDSLTGLYNRRYYEDALQRIDKEENLPFSVIIGDLNGLKLVNDAFGHMQGDELLKCAAEGITAAVRRDDVVARWGGDEFIVLLPKCDAEMVRRIVDRARKECSMRRVNSILVDVSFGWDTKDSIEITLPTLIKNAEDLMYKSKIVESKSMRDNTIKTVMKTLHEKNPREEQHSKRVGEISSRIASALHYSDMEIGTLNLIGHLHDIGKIAIDESILNMPGILSAEELRIIRQHPEIGCRIIRSAYEILDISEAILSHHERWDGAGYPRGLKGEEIPRFGRIIAVADSFDAMTSERTYRKRMTVGEAAAEIHRCAGTQFDPEIAEVFVTDVLGLEWARPDPVSYSQPAAMDPI